VVTYGLVAIGLGAVFGLLGWLGVTGRLLRAPSSDTVRNFYGQLLLGPALVGGGLIVVFQDQKAVAGLLVLPIVALFVTGLWTTLVRPPAWLKPRFPLQRDRATDGTDR
jgi:hypothetical protein